MEPSINCDTNIWEPITAIGTLLASTVALMVAFFGNSMKYRIRHPKFIISNSYYINFDDSENNSDGSTPMSSVDLLIYIENIGKLDAEKCFGKVKTISEQNLKKTDFFEKICLGNGKYLQRQDNENTKIQIKKNDKQALKIGTISQPSQERTGSSSQDAILLLSILDKKDNSINLEKGKRYKLIIQIECDHISTINKDIEIEWNGGPLSKFEDSLDFNFIN